MSRIASPKQRRGEITTDEDVRQLFSHLTKDKQEPANPQTNPWKIKPFKRIIRGDKYQSSLKHDVEVEIRNGMQYADYLNIAKNTFLTLIYQDFPNGSPTSSRTLADAKVAEYNKTMCHKKLEQRYKGATGIWSHTGEVVDAMGQHLYMMLGQRDPALFTLEMFRQARNDRRFADADGKIKYGALSQIRCIIQFVALDIPDSPMAQIRFQFKDGDEWYTKGRMKRGFKKDDYLQEAELIAYIQNINEPDTLVLHRLGLEGGGRISSQLLMGTKLPNGYLCQAFWGENKIAMFEPKVQESKTGGIVTRYFTPETMAFFKRYVDDNKIVGAWFNRSPSEQMNYQSFNTSLKLAGLRAGIWRYKIAQKGQALAEGEKLAPNGRVYVLKQQNSRLKGTQFTLKEWVTEGKMTSTHAVMKHTFVSQAGLHGLSLDDCAEQCGTDPTTIRDFYHGTLGDKLRAAILGEKSFEPWKDWIHRKIDPLYTKRYNELMSNGKPVIDIKAIQQEEAALAEAQ